MIFQHASFNELSKHTLYNILRLRSEVFVVEQKCIWLDTDGHDPDAIHIWAEEDNTIVAYSRILNAGYYYPEACLGRVVVSPSYRTKGIGHQLMGYTLETLHKKFGEQPVKIMAQSYLKTFYESYGFEIYGDEFDDCGIMHYYMLKN